MPLTLAEQDELRQMHQQLQVWAERIEELHDQEHEKVDRKRKPAKSRFKDYSLPNCLSTITNRMIEVQQEIDETINEYADR